MTVPAELDWPRQIPVDLGEAPTCAPQPEELAWARSACPKTMPRKPAIPRPAALADATLRAAATAETAKLLLREP